MVGRWITDSINLRGLTRSTRNRPHETPQWYAYLTLRMCYIGPIRRELEAAAILLGTGWYEKF